MVGIEVTNDPSQVVREAKRMGLIILTAGKMWLGYYRHWPSLKQLEKGIEILTEIIWFINGNLSKISSWYTECTIQQSNF